MSDHPFVAFVKKHLFKILGGLAGLILGICFLTIGFFKTMLVLLLCAIGVAIGLYFDHNHTVINWINRNLGNKDGDDHNDRILR